MTCGCDAACCGLYTIAAYKLLDSNVRAVAMATDVFVYKSSDIRNLVGRKMMYLESVASRVAYCRAPRED